MPTIEDKINELSAGDADAKSVLLCLLHRTEDKDLFKLFLHTLKQKDLTGAKIGFVFWNQFSGNMPSFADHLSSLLEQATC